MKCEGFDVECANEDAVACVLVGSRKTHGALHAVNLCASCQERIKREAEENHGPLTIHREDEAEGQGAA